MSDTSAGDDREYALSRSTASDNWLFDEILRVLSPQRGWRVLDVGCNTGELDGRLSEVGCETLGIDISRDAIAIARQRFPRLKFEATELAALDRGPFDAIVSSHVIEHLVDPESFLKAARGRLREGGTLLLVTPNRHAFLHAFLHRLRNIPLFYDPTHQRLFAPGELRRMLRKAGFGRVTTSTRMLYFPWASRLPVRTRLRIPSLQMGDHLFCIASVTKSQQTLTE